MSKIDEFYKLHANFLRFPLFTLCKLIEAYEYFPKCIRNAKCTLLKKRTIYSLSFLPKIIEKVFYKGFQKCLEQEYVENSDPFQMAYEPSRGVDSCNLMSLASIEYSVKENNSSCIQLSLDLKKAFNRANRSTILETAERVAGCGKILDSWFSKRKYSFESEEHDFRANCGVPPGTLFGVFGFKCFIMNDKDMTNENPEVLWPGFYSDDRNPIFIKRDIDSGRAQKIISSSVDFMKRNKCEYHTTGTKRPILLYYKTKRSEPSSNYMNLKVLDYPVEVATETKMLGMRIATESKRVGSASMINTHSYVLHPPVSRYCSLASRFQALVGEFEPPYMKRLVESYFCGLFNFSSCHYWTRAVKADLATIRY